MSVEPLGDWRRTNYSLEITPEMDGKNVIVFGWAETIRDLGGIKFIILGDREGTVQVTIPLKKLSEKLAAKVAEIKKQYVFGVRGTVKKSDKAHRGVEIVPDDIRILNTTVHPLALDPTGRVPADIDVRLNARILDLRRPESRSIFIINHHVTYAIRDFLTTHAYVEVQTPKIIATATEGGAALFPVVYFDKEAFLAQSPQLYKEELTTTFEKVFEIGSFFRAEESHTTRHISEFISVDIEEAFADQNDVMKILEELIAHIVNVVREKCAKELDILKVNLKLLSLPLKQYTYDEILQELKEKDIAIPWGEDIPTPALRTIGDNHPEEFYFIVDWPTKAKAFYIKPRDDDERLCEGFDFMYSWVELASGGSRIHEKDLLVSRMKEAGLKPESFEHHLKVYDTGMPPHAGWGMGLNRLVMVLCGKDNIRECVLFPRDRFRLTP